MWLRLPFARIVSIKDWAQPSLNTKESSSSIDLHKIYCFKFNVNDLSLVMIIVNLMLTWDATPFIMSMISLESPTIFTSQTTNLVFIFRSLLKMCPPAILFMVLLHTHANYSLVFSVE